MEASKDLNEVLYEKMEDEYNDFIDGLHHMKADEIIQHSNERVIKEDILLIAYENDLPEEQVKALLRMKYPLDECYAAWSSSDYSYMTELKECITENAQHICKLQKQRVLSR